jgi:hypothetical protein
MDYPQLRRAQSGFGIPARRAGMRNYNSPSLPSRHSAAKDARERADAGEGQAGQWRFAVSTLIPDACHKSADAK